MSLEFSPPSQFRPLLVWMWTGHLDHTWLLRQVRKSAEAGFGGLVIRAGYAMTPAFLSDEWFVLVRAVAQECHAAGLQLWLGDEGAGATGTFNSQDGSGRSGQGAGRITRESPQLRRQILKFSSETLTRDDIARGALDGWKLAPPEGELLYAVAVPNAGRKLDFTRAVPLYRSDAEQQTRFIKRLGGDVRILTFAFQSADYVDLLNPQTGAEYLHSVHERLREGLGEEWDLLHGLWTQSPALRPHLGATDELPWSPILPEVYEQQPGYELLEWLPALIADIGDDASRLRQDFWRTVSAMETVAFWSPLQQWARAHNKEYGGYAPGCESLNAVVASHGDIEPIYRLWPRPTIEAAGLNCGDHPLDLGRALHAKLAASVIALHPQQASETQNQVTRLTAEAWRDGGWGATLSDRMSSLHHLLRQGVNSFSAHGWQVNGREDMPFLPAPDGQSQPYVAGWKSMNAYIARCSWLLSHGQSGARVALLWPIRSAQAHHHPRGHRFTRWVEEDLNATALMLDDLHFEWLFATEDDIMQGSIENGALFCGALRQRFELIVLPSVTALARETWMRLEEFVEQGGKVACLGLLPRYSQSGRDLAFEEEISRSTMVTVDELYAAYALLEDSGDSASAASFAMTRDHESGGRFSSYQPRLNPDVRDALLRVRQLLKESVLPELETQASDILYARRLLAADEILGNVSAVPPQVLAPQAVSAKTAEDKDLNTETEVEPDQVTFAWDKPFDWGDNAAQDELETTDDDDFSDDEDAPLPILNDHALSAQREHKGGDLFWVFNASERAQNCNILLRPRREGVPYEIDAWTGEMRVLPVRMNFDEFEGGGLSLALEMAPQQARLLWVRPNEADEAQQPHIEAATWMVEGWDGRLARGYVTHSGAPRTAIRRGESLQRHSGESVKVPAPLLMPDTWQANRVGPNVLVPPLWQWQRGRHLPGQQRLLFGREQWQSLPAHDADLARDAFERLEVSGIVTLRTQFEIAQLPDELFLPLAALDVPYDLYLNGELLDELRPDWSVQTPFEGAQWHWFDLAPYAKIGQNILSCVVDCRERTVETSQSHVVARVPGPPRLLGDFSLTPDGAITAPQSLVLHGESWHEQGLPFYAGAIDYRQWIKTPDDWQRCRIFLELSRCRDVTGLWLNGRFIDQKICVPYRFDVTRQIIKGASNEVRLRVWNTAQALFEAHDAPPAPSGLLGPVRLVAYPLITPLIENER